MLMSISQNQYKLTMPEYKNSSTNIKFEHRKCIRISEKAHLRSYFRKKKSPWVELEPTKEIYFRAGIQKYFVRFLVHVKTVEFAFEIIWPLEYNFTAFVLNKLWPWFLFACPCLVKYRKKANNYIKVRDSRECATRVNVYNQQSHLLFR